MALLGLAVSVEYEILTVRDPSVSFPTSGGVFFPICEMFSLMNFKQLKHHKNDKVIPRRTPGHLRPPFGMRAPATTAPAVTGWEEVTSPRSSPGLAGIPWRELGSSGKDIFPQVK